MSPGRHAATRSCCGSISCNTPTTNGFETGTLVPSPQSQSSSRSYRSILPTFLAYIVPSTRGCSPWRPDAIKSATGSGWNLVLHIFKGRRESIGHHAACGALPASGPYLWLTDSRVCSHLNPSQKIKVGRRCTPQKDPTNQIPYALWVYSTIYPYTSQTPWSMFQDGFNGEPTGQRSKCTVADLGSRLERLRAVGFGCPNARRAVAVTAKRVKLEPPLDVTAIDADSYLGQPRARGRCAIGLMALGVTCVQRLDGSWDSAIHTKYRILLHSSSM
ncbi:hypothetical protein FXO38_31266 [Capsicum annuum]|nr:hypothetical protein FXO38_31266 [Capsicum annuum]